MSLRQVLRVFSLRMSKLGGVALADAAAEADADADGVAGLALAAGEGALGEAVVVPAFGVVATLLALLPPLLLAAVLLPPFAALSLSMTAFHPWTQAFARAAMSAWDEARSLPTIWPILVVCGRRYYADSEHPPISLRFAVALAHSP